MAVSTSSLEIRGQLIYTATAETGPNLHERRGFKIPFSGSDEDTRRPQGQLDEGLAPSRVHGREAAGSRDEVVRGSVLHDATVFHYEHPVGDRHR